MTTTRAWPARNLLRNYGVSGIADFTKPSFDITSITVYRRQTSLVNEELTSGNVPVIVSDSEKNFAIFYQEFRALTTTPGPFGLVLGATYLWDRTRQRGNSSILPPLNSGAYTTATSTIGNWSAYAQGSYDLTDRLTLTASGRFIHETNDTVTLVNRRPRTLRAADSDVGRRVACLDHVEPLLQRFEKLPLERESITERNAS